MWSFEERRNKWRKASDKELHNCYYFVNEKLLEAKSKRVAETSKSGNVKILS